MSVPVVEDYHKGRKDAMVMHYYEEGDAETFFLKGGRDKSELLNFLYQLTVQIESIYKIEYVND